MRKWLISASIGVLVIFGFVTLYFYVQHNVPYQVSRESIRLEVGGSEYPLIQVREVLFESKRIDRERILDGTPWYWKVAPHLQVLTNEQQRGLQNGAG